MPAADIHTPNHVYSAWTHLWCVLCLQGHSCANVQRKRALLEEEGVKFDENYKVWGPGALAASCRLLSKGESFKSASVTKSMSIVAGRYGRVVHMVYSPSREGHKMGAISYRIL